MNWQKIRLALLVFFSVVLALQLPATLFIDGKLILDFISIARSFQLITAIILSVLATRTPEKIYLNAFLNFSIVIQVIASINYEPKNELVAYNFIAILIIISAVTYRKNLKQWLVFNFPIHLSALVLPIFFKDNILHNTVSSFINNFLFGIFSLVVSIVVVSIYSTQEYFSLKLAQELNDQEKKLNDEFQKIQKMKVQLEIGNLAFQVAHDIRSPLAALENINMSENADPAEQKITKEAIRRLKGIANTLLEKGRSSHISNVAEIEIGSVIKTIIDAKTFEFPRRQINFKSINNNLISKIDNIKFESILSNLINNALEASPENSTISIMTTTDYKNIFINIIDHGKGIPPELLSKLGNEKITFEKTEGNGLGVFSSAQIIKEWGGTFNISSELNKGTTVTISLPLITHNQTIESIHVLLDNDELVRITWKSKAKKAGVNLSTFSNSSELFESLTKFPFDTNFYIDSELDNEKGEDIAQRLFNMGYSNLIMCSGYPEEKFANLKFIKNTIDKTPPFKS